MSLPPNKNLLAEYPNTYYVETGSYRGDSIQAAVNAKFKYIRSIDIDRNNVLFCKSRFDLIVKPTKQIMLYTGDSAVKLESMIADINEPITFFLDSHSQMFEGEVKHANPFPLLLELEQIRKHYINYHTIIIDDWHIFYPDRVGYGKDDIKKALFDINPGYQLRHVANPVIDDILIATLCS